MPAQVKLTVVKGQLSGKEFVFDGRTSCILGRAEDCSPRLPNDEEHRTISRHHCLLDVNPPDVRIRDFGSLNGTYVNGKKIGQRESHQTPDEAAQTQMPEHDLRDGDCLELGDTVFRVQVTMPLRCGVCGAEVPAAEKTVAEVKPGELRCAGCRGQADATRPVQRSQRGKVCSRYGRDASHEVGDQRHGDFVCARCRTEPAAIAQALLEKSRRGAAALDGLRDYTILRELGRGGMGAVYLARHTKTGQQVALKVMLPQIAAEPEAQELFLREVENTKALQHPHVVRLHEAGCVDGVFYFTLEYCDGGSVDHLLKQHGGPLPVREAVALTINALHGLDYAHTLHGPTDGLVHRDMKPGNLFLSGSGDGRLAKVGDYGLAKEFDMAGLSGQTRSGALAGSPAFMPRQQVISFKYAKPEVDVWATAASLYYMLTLHTPRDFPRGKDWWQAVLQTDAVPIRRRAPTVPAKLAEVIDLALIDKPAIRVTTAEELKRLLESEEW